MKLRNGKKYWVCICGEIFSGSTFCPICSHKPSNLVSVSVTKRFYVPDSWVVFRAKKLLQIDAREKLAKIMADNRAYLATKESEKLNAISQSRAKANQEKYQFSKDEFRRRELAFLESKKPIPELSGHLSRIKPSVAIELNPETFEWYCAEWCVYLGHKNVRVTRSTKDGGIDIHGDGFIAQVKFQEIPVGVKAIRELAGLVSVRASALGYFFTVNGYSPQALVEGKELGLALFTLRPFKSEIIANSDLAALVLEDIELTS